MAIIEKMEFSEMVTGIWLDPDLLLKSPAPPHSAGREAACKMAVKDRVYLDGQPGMLLHNQVAQVF